MILRFLTRRFYQIILFPENIRLNHSVWNLCNMPSSPCTMNYVSFARAEAEMDVMGNRLKECLLKSHGSRRAWG